MFLGTNCYKPHSFKSTLSSETRLFSCARQELCKLHSFCSTDLADRLDTVCVCVCIRWAVCVFVSFQTNNKRAFRFKFSPAKQMTVSLQEKKNVKVKKGHRREREREVQPAEKKSLTRQFDCCCHGNQADAEYYGLH